MLVHTVAKAQREAGHSVYFCVRQRAPLANAAHEDDFKSIEYCSGMHILTFPFEFKRKVCELDLDIIHFHQLRAVRRLLPLLPKQAPRPMYVFTEHSPRPHSIASWYNSYVLKMLDEIIVVSKSQQNVIAEQLSLSRERLRVLYNGIDLSKYSPPKENRAKNEQKTVVLAGRVVPDKGHETFIEAAEAVLSQRKDIRFCICGEIENVPEKQKTYIQKLKTRIKQLGRQNDIVFEGFVADVAQYFRSADLVVVPSKIEPFGLVAAEAMACAAPVVVSNAGALPEVVDNGKAGLIVPVDDADSLAEAINKVLDNQSATEQRVQNAISRVSQHFSLDAHISGLDKIYRELLS